MRPISNDTTKDSTRLPEMAVSKFGSRSRWSLCKGYRLCHNLAQRNRCMRGRARKSAGSYKLAGGFMPNVRVLATDLEFPEGPVVMPDGSVVLVEIRGQR